MCIISCHPWQVAQFSQLKVAQGWVWLLLTTMLYCLSPKEACEMLFGQGMIIYIYIYIF